MADNEQRQADRLDPVILGTWSRSLRDVWWELLDFERRGAKRLKGLAKRITGTGDFTSLYQQKQNTATGLDGYYSDYVSRYTSGNYFKRQWSRFKGWWRNETAFYRYCKDREKYEKTCADFIITVSEIETSAARVTIEQQPELITRSDRRVFSRYLSRPIAEDALSSIVRELENIAVPKRSGVLHWLSKKILSKRGVLGTLTSFFKSHRRAELPDAPLTPVAPTQRVVEDPLPAVVAVHNAELSSQGRYIQLLQWLPVQGEPLNVFEVKLNKLGVHLKELGYQEVKWIDPNEPTQPYCKLTEDFVDSVLNRLGWVPEKGHKDHLVLCVYIYESYRICREIVERFKQPGGALTRENYAKFLHSHFKRSLSLWRDGQQPGTAAYAYCQYCYEMLSQYFQDALSKLSMVVDAADGTRRAAYEELFAQSLSLNRALRANTQQLIGLSHMLVEQGRSQDVLRADFQVARATLQTDLAKKDKKLDTLQAELAKSRKESSKQIAALTQMMQQLMAQMGAQRSQSAQQAQEGQPPSLVSVGGNLASTFGGTGGGETALVQQAAAVASVAGEEGEEQEDRAAVASMP